MNEEIDENYDDIPKGKFDFKENVDKEFEPLDESNSLMNEFNPCEYTSDIIHGKKRSRNSSKTI